MAALNLFIDDIYHEQRALKDGVVPRAYIEKSREFRPQCVGVDVPGGVWSHVCGSDLVRDRNGVVHVLEDNLRVPSGVSYMLENREVMKRVFPELFEHLAIHPVDDYPRQLQRCLAAAAPDGAEAPRIAVLTPGIHNSAYFEHSYLAQAMAVELVEGRDLVVGDDDCVYVRTIEGLVRLHVLYRRVDDLFLDPETFHEHSLLGAPGLMRAWRAGNVALAKRARLRRRGRQGDLHLCARPHPLLLGRGAAAAQRAFLPLRGEGRARPCARQPRPVGGEAGRTNPAATAC